MKTDGPGIGALREKGKVVARDRRRGNGRTDENATGKSYRDTANPREGTWATRLHLRARACACTLAARDQRQIA